MEQEIIVLEKPKIPTTWNYKESIKKIKVLVYKWKNLTKEVVEELFIARNILSSQGARTDLNKKETWDEYCNEIGIEKRTANRWIERYIGTNVPKLEIETPPLPEGKYQVIYCDIPWKYDVDLSRGATRSPENNYPVMDLDTIKDFGEEVNKLATDNCVLFMWITSPKLNWMNDVLEACKFEYKTSLIWDKIKPNLGHYSSVRHEILIIAGRGNSAPTCDGKAIQSIDSVQSIEKSSRHSEKPLEFMDIIDKLYPNWKKIELFARNKNKRPNWRYWGAEANT